MSNLGLLGQDIISKVQILNQCTSCASRKKVLNYRRIEFQKWPLVMKYGINSLWFSDHIDELMQKQM